MFAPYINSITTLFIVPTDAHCYTNHVVCICFLGVTTHCDCIFTAR